MNAIVGQMSKCYNRSMDSKKWLMLGLVIILLLRFVRKRKKSTLGELIHDPDVKELLQMEKYIHPDIKRLKTREIGPKHSSIYAVKFLKPEYCSLLIRVAERYGDWDSKSKGDYGKGMTLPIDFIPELQRQYTEMVKKYLFPCAAKLFPTFNPTHHDEVYILRYRADNNKQKGMDAHYDGEPLACILTLNNKFKGGGTFFPKWNLVARVSPGEMMLYPGGLSHLHGGKTITAGRRYVLLHALYDRVLNGNQTSVWEDGEPQHDRESPVVRD